MEFSQHSFYYLYLCFFSCDVSDITLSVSKTTSHLLYSALFTNCHDIYSTLSNISRNGQIKWCTITYTTPSLRPHIETLNILQKELSRLSRESSPEKIQQCQFCFPVSSSPTLLLNRNAHVKCPLVQSQKSCRHYFLPLSDFTTSRPHPALCNTTLLI